MVEEGIKIDYQLYRKTRRIPGHQRSIFCFKCPEKL